MCPKQKNGHSVPCTSSILKGKQKSIKTYLSFMGIHSHVDLYFETMNKDTN